MWILYSYSLSLGISITRLQGFVYQKVRKEAYPDWGTQLDYIYHNGIEKWKTDMIDPIKAKYPKPS